MAERQIWVNSSDVMTIAKLYNLNYEDAVSKIVEILESESKEAVFVE